MGRKSLKVERRREIVLAFSKVLAQQGYAGATIIAISEEAKLSPGLIHHHFKNKDEIMFELLNYLIGNFKERLRSEGKPIDLNSYVESSLGLGPKANTIMAQCWVGVFAEAIRNPSLFRKVKQHIANEIETIEKISDSKLDAKESTSVLAYIVGSLIIGSFQPLKTQGFGLHGGIKLIDCFLES